MSKDRIPLTLKTLYRMLTQPDFLIHSYVVFPPSSLRGQTISRFWHTLFQAGLPTDTDLSVFDASEKRSRSLTRLLNSAGSGRFMASWYDALSAALSPDSLLALTRAWMDRLEQWHYQSVPLSERLASYVRSLAVEEELRAFLMTQAVSLSGGSADETPLLFRQGVLLSWLTLYALYGALPQAVRLDRLRAEGATAPSALYRLDLRRPAAPQPRVISARQCALCVQPLAPSSFFGREVELDRAREILATRGRLLVSGLGGLGKTEFTRQLLYRLVQSGFYGSLAFVQYEGTLENSYRQAFPALREVPEGSAEILARQLLEAPDNGRTLLLIDGVDGIPAGDSALSHLAEYGCDVLLTSRLAALDGFESLCLEGLPPEEGRRLFCSLAHPAPEESGAVDELCAAVVGHPLAITLFACLCRARFWSVDRLARHLRERGLADLRYIHQASPVNLADIFSDLFTRALLSRPQSLLLTLLSLLPDRYWLPADLLPWAADLFPVEEDLADTCRVLADLGWLLCGDLGYAIHPLIAETVRLQPADADAFPLLWAHLLNEVCVDNPFALQAVPLLVPRFRFLNLSAIRCLAELEQRVGLISWLRLPEELYMLHREFLDTHPHAAADETDYWLGWGFREVIVFSRVDRLDRCLEPILRSGPEHVRNAQSLYSLLEFACKKDWKDLVEQGFALMRPENSESLHMADYLISLSEKQRLVDQSPDAAETSLREADALLARWDQRHTPRQADLNYRLAVCLLDRGAPGEAVPLLQNCLEILRSLGRPDDTPKMMTIRNTCAVALSFLGDSESALKEYQYLASLYRRQGRRDSGEYAILRNNIAMLLDTMTRFEEAQTAMEEVLRLDETLKLPPRLVAAHQRNMAFILSHTQAWAQALPFAQEALRIRSEIFGPSSSWTADAQAVYALPLAFLGEADKALVLIDEACETLKKAWGSSHRHTQNAEKNREMIREIAKNAARRENSCDE